MEAKTSAGDTLASWSSILSGLHPPSHGLRYHFPSPGHLAAYAALPDRLPARLREAGWRTAAASDWAGDTFRAVDFGFEETPCHDVRRTGVYLADGLYRSHPLLPLVFAGTPPARLLPDLDERTLSLLEPDELVRRSVREIDEARAEGRPFFVVHFGSRTHLPYAGVAPFAGRFNRPDYAGPSRYRMAFSAEDVLFGGRSVPPEEVEQVRALYDAGVLAFDAELGLLLDHLEATGAAANTIVVVTSDHGEDLFDPGTRLGHGQGMRGGDQGYRVPLVVAGPGVVPGRHPGVGRLGDRAPTILDLAGLAPTARADGESFAPALRGEPLEPRIAYAESTYLFAPPDEPGQYVPPWDGPTLRYEPALDAFALDPRYHDPVLRAKIRMARADGWKLVRVPLAGGCSADRLYDMAADPRQERDVAVEHPDVVRRLAWFLDRVGP